MKKIDKGFYLSEFLTSLKIQIQDESYLEMEDYKQQIVKITNDIINQEQRIFLIKYIESIFKIYGSTIYLSEDEGEKVIQEVLKKIDDLPLLKKAISIYDFIPFKKYYPDKAIYDKRVFISLIKKGFCFDSKDYKIDDFIDIKDKEFLLNVINN